MLKRLSFLCAALLALAACSHDNGSNAAPPVAPVASGSTATTAPAASSPAPASVTTAAPSPAASTAPAAGSTTTAAAAATPAAPAAAFVDNGKWVEGKNYFRIEPAQPTSHPGKIEVTEVFSYGCPACNAFHTTAEQIAKNLPANAVMVYIPASFIPQENWPTLQRAYFTAQAMGVADKGNEAMFDAVWKTKELSSMNAAGTGLKPTSALPTIEDIAKVYAKFGADPQQFAGIANSFAVNIKMKRADDLIKAYGVTGTPTMVINGKYRFDVGNAGGYAQAVELTQWLVAREAAGK